MRTYLECIPCVVRQAVEAVRFATDDENIHEQVVREVLRIASEMDLRSSPPAMAAQIHRLIRRLTNNPDPYRQLKDRSNALGMRLYPRLKEQLGEVPDPLELAVRLSIAGNIIDAGLYGELDERRVLDTLSEAENAPLHGSVENLRTASRKVKDILFLADNAGEIAFDRLLIEQLGTEKITLAVRAHPTINDATRIDADAVGLTSLVEVIDNGSDVPGTILSECSPGFRDRFARADLIIAKGQGNYETLSDVDRPALFLFKAKCPVIVRYLSAPIGSLMLTESNALGIARE